LRIGSNEGYLFIYYYLLLFLGFHYFLDYFEFNFLLLFRPLLPLFEITRKGYL